MRKPWLTLVLCLACILGALGADGRGTEARGRAKKTGRGGRGSRAARGGRRGGHGSPYQRPSTFAADANHVLTISVTITPYKTRGGVAFDDDDRMTMCGTLLDLIYVEFGMRFQDGALRCFSFSRERGEKEREPHINGHYDLWTDKSDKPKLLSDEHKALKALLHTATDMPFRLVMVPVNPNNRTYGYGYDFKDEGEAHFRNVRMGLTDEEVRQALDFYRARAAANAYSGGKKMNKNPAASSKQLDFKVGSVHVLAAWFVAQHGLQLIARWLTVPIIIALAIQTGAYRLDESCLVGKNGGEALDPHRSDALFQLIAMGFVKHTTLRDLVPCIETVLHGAPRAHATANGMDNGPGVLAVPSTFEIVQRYDLASLKTLCETLREQTQPGPTEQRDPRGGRFIVLDFLSMPQSAETVAMFTAAGLVGRSCFSRAQLPDACGYLATGWATMLRALGPAFSSLECAAAAQLNAPAFITTANTHLGKMPDGDASVAAQLTSDEIIELASKINPDGEGMAPAWLHSPRCRSTCSTPSSRARSPSHACTGPCTWSS